MHTFNGGPCEPEDSDRNKHRTGHSGGETELGLGDTVIIRYKSSVVSCPERICEGSGYHADKKPEECAPDHLKVEMVNVREDEGESLKEDVQNAEENRCEGTEQGDHGFENE